MTLWAQKHTGCKVPGTKGQDPRDEWCARQSLGISRCRTPCGFHPRHDKHLRKKTCVRTIANRRIGLTTNRSHDEKRPSPPLVRVVRRCATAGIVGGRREGERNHWLSFSILLSFFFLFWLVLRWFYMSRKKKQTLQVVRHTHRKKKKKRKKKQIE